MRSRVPNKEVLIEVLRANNGSVVKAAKQIGVSTKSIYQHVRNHGIESETSSRNSGWCDFMANVPEEGRLVILKGCDDIRGEIKKHFTYFDRWLFKEWKLA